MNVKIRLTLQGRKGKKQRSFRVIAVDSRKKRDTSDYLADLGYYNPQTKELMLNREEIKKLVANGAQLSSTVKSLINKNNLPN